MEDEVPEVKERKGTRRPGFHQGILAPVAHQRGLCRHRIRHRGEQAQADLAMLRARDALVRSEPS